MFHVNSTLQLGTHPNMHAVQKDLRELGWDFYEMFTELTPEEMNATTGIKQLKMLIKTYTGNY